MALSPARITRLFCFSGHAYAHTYMLLFPTVVLGLGTVFAMDYDALIALATPGFIAFGAGSVPAAWLGQKWSAKGMLAIFFIGTGGAAIFTGLSEGPVMLGVGLTLIGVFASIYHPVGISMLVANAKNLGKTMGLNGMAGNMGTAIAPIVAGSLMAWIDWRWAFIIPGIFGVLTGLAFLALVPAEQAQQDSVPHRYAHTITRRDLIRVFSFLSIATITIGIAATAAMVALPKLFAERLGSSLASGTDDIGAWVTLIFGISAFAQLLIGHMIDKFPLKHIYLVMLTLQAPLFFLVAGYAGAPLLLVAGAMVFANLGSIPLGDALIARYADEQWRSTIYGLKFVLALGVSAAGVPLVAFMHGSTGDFTTLFHLLAGMALITALMAWVLPSPKKIN